MVTALFTGGEAVYLYIIVPVMAMNHNQYVPEASPIIESCCLGLFIVLCEGVAMYQGVPGVST